MKLCFEKLKNYGVPICLIVLIIICVMHFFAQSNEAVEQSTYKYLSGISVSQSIAFNQKFGGMYSALEAFAAGAGDWKGADRVRTLSGMKALQNAFGFDFVLFIDEKGMGMNQTGHMDIDLSQRSYFKESIRGRRAVAYVPSGAVDRQNSFVGISVPLYGDNKNVKGVLYVSYRTQNFIHLLASLTYGRADRSYIVGSDGQVIVVSNPGRDCEGRIITNVFDSFAEVENSEKNLSQIRADMAQGITNTFSYDFNGIPFCASYTPLGAEICDWYIINVAKRGSADDTEIVISRHARVLVLELLLLGALLVFYTSFQTNLRYKLAETAERARSASLAKSAFISRMSHEIRTPLNAIIGMTLLAQQNSYDPDRVKDYLSKITLSSRMLLNIINDILDMSAIENRKLIIAETDFCLRELLSSLTAVYDEQCRARAISFTVEYENVAEEWFKGDGVRLNQILLNLLSNAVKFTEPGGSIGLNISSVEKTKEGSRLRFVISDSGCGMSDDMLSRIFKPFERERGAKGQRYAGTGLGMSIVWNLVELMGGTISVESAEGVGTTFTMDLPFKTGAKYGIRSIAGEQREPSSGAPRYNFAGRRVLVVEDNAMNREIATELLHSVGFTVVCAVNGKEAAELFEASALGTYDAILMDIQMPVMDGFEATRRIRYSQHSDSATVPIIAMTANAFSDDEARSREMGIDDYVTKPTDPKTLFRVLAKHCGLLSQLGNRGTDSSSQ